MKANNMKANNMKANSMKASCWWTMPRSKEERSEKIKGQSSCYFIINFILKPPTHKSPGMRLFLSYGVNTDRQRKRRRILRPFQLRADFGQCFTFHISTLVNPLLHSARLYYWPEMRTPFLVSGASTLEGVHSIFLLVPMLHIPFVFGQNDDKVFQAKFGNRNPFFSLI